MGQDYGYPSEADIEIWLAALGIELTSENNVNFMQEYRQEVFGIVNALRFAMTLSVYCPTTTTFNVRGGEYQFAGVVKTFTAPSNIDPVDNDTTYIWMKPDNSIGSAIDGTGWPATEHIKLAEIDVDSGGVITDVRDRRGDAFMIHQVTGLQCAEAGTGGGVTFVLAATLASGNTVAIHNADAPFKYRVLDAWSIAKSADGGTWKLTDGTNDITDAVTVTGTDKTVDRAGTIDDSYYEIAAGGSLSVVGDGADADVEVNVLCMRVS